MSDTARHNGQTAAILSAALFGISPAICKAIAGEMPTVLLAGLLYLGSGLGLLGMVLWQRLPVISIFKAITGRQLVTLFGTVASGGIAAPLFLTYGIRYGSATEVSLLLNFEAVATTLLAWIVFHEQIGLRVWLGKLLIVGASVQIILTGYGTTTFSIPGLAVIAACILWGIDNNLTRELESLPAVLLAGVKGFSAGLFNVVFALFIFNGSATSLQILETLILGALSYGASLVLFIYALREIGTSRTSTWFATGPFIGTLFSILLLGEQPPFGYWMAAFIMLSGVFFLHGERHQHCHTHEFSEHTHMHSHDVHHQHDHGGSMVNSPHEHRHRHEPITHSHLHWPDIHHRHNHPCTLPE